VGGSKGDFYAAAHIQGIAPDDSGWIGATSVIPEPSTYAAILAALALGIVGIRRWRRVHG